MGRTLALLALGALGSGLLQGQSPEAALLLGVAAEWNVGRAWGTPSTSPTAQQNHATTFGVAIPFPLRDHWEIRPRYADTRLDASTVAEPLVQTDRVKHYALLMDVLWSTEPSRWSSKGPALVVGAGLGLQKTWHRRDLLGTGPGQPLLSVEEDSLAPVASLSAGLRLNAAFSLEARCAWSSHTFRGSTLNDRVVTVSVHVWPAVALMHWIDDSR